MDYYVKYLNLINSGQKVLFEDFKAKFKNLKYILINLEELEETIADGEIFDDLITDMIMSSLDVEYMFDNYDEYEEYFEELKKKIKYLRYKYNMERRLRILMIEGITVDKFGEFCERMKKGKLKDRLDDKQLFQLYKQIADKGGKKFNLNLSLEYIEKIQYEKQFMEIINLADSKKLVPLLRNIILDRYGFSKFYEEYKVCKKENRLPSEIERDSQGRLQLRGTSYFAIEYDKNYSTTQSRIVFSNGQVVYADKVNMKSNYMPLFKDVMSKELLCSKLAKQFRVNSSQYDVALYDEEEALIREEQYDENGQLILGSQIVGEKENDINNILEKTEEYLKQNGITVEKIKELKVEFLKMVLFDKLVNQASRNNDNWAVYLSENDAKFAPLFNNFNCFGKIDLSKASPKLRRELETKYKMLRELNKNPKEFLMCINGEASLNAFLNEYYREYPELEIFISRNIELLDLEKAAKEIKTEKNIKIDISKYVKQLIENKKEVRDFIKEKNLEKSKDKEFEREKVK